MPAEVLVFGQKYPILGQRKFHHVFVHGTALKLTYREHIVTVSPEGSNCGEIAAFIREESHRPDLLETKRHDGFVRDGVGRIRQRCPNVIRD